MNPRTKTYIAIGILGLVFAIAFGYVFPKLNAKNLAAKESLNEKNTELAEFQEEQKSYELGKRDLGGLAEKPIKPEELFSKDTKVVKEVKTLEDLAKSLALESRLTVAGTAKNATKLPKANAQILTIPYTLSVQGKYDKVVNFLDYSEHLNFIMSYRTVTMVAEKDGLVKALFSGDFYILK